MAEIFSPRLRGEYPAVGRGRGVDQGHPVNDCSVMRDKRLQEFARANRRQMSDGERMVWSQIRRRGIGGVRFRRQYPIGSFIADFACVELRLVIEVDGNQHIGSAYDQARDTYMSKRGWTVLRVWVGDVMYDLDAVMDDILGRIEQLQRSP